MTTAGRGERRLVGPPEYHDPVRSILGVRILRVSHADVLGVDEQIVGPVRGRSHPRGEGHSRGGLPGGRVLGHEHADLHPAIFALAKEKDWPLRELGRDHRTLERVFNDLVASSDETDDEEEMKDFVPNPGDVDMPSENGDAKPTEDDAALEEEL